MKFFVVGCGSIGTRHTHILKGLGYSDIVVFDVDQSLLSEFGRGHDVRTVQSLEDGIALEPDVALICVPNHLHISTSIVLARAGLHLFIEKPLDASLSRLTELTSIIHDHRLVNMVGCNFRFDGGLVELRRILKEEGIGRVQSIHARFGQYLPDWRPNSDYKKNYAARKETGGGVMLDRIHEFDYVFWLMGGAKSVHGLAAKISDLQIDTEDIAEVSILHESGSISTIHLDYLRREYECACEVIGDKGILKWDFKERSLRYYFAPTKEWKDLSANIPQDRNEMYVEQMKYFVECVHAGSRTMNTVPDAAETLRFVLEAREKILCT